MAQQHGVWLFNRAGHAQLPGHSFTEWYVGDNLLALDDARLRDALALWCNEL